MNYIYLVDRKNYIILDTGGCNRSKRTIDINVYDLENNDKLLDLLHLAYFEHAIDDSQRFEYFCDYLSAFQTSGEKQKFRIDEKINDKLKSNPIIRIIIENKELLTKVKNEIDGMVI